MRIRAIINPSAGRQSLQKNAEILLTRLLDEGVASKIDIFHTKGAGDAFMAARSFQPWEADLVLAVGGDGTVNEVVNGMIGGQHRTPLAIMPAGTSNDFAYAMKIPQSVDDYFNMVKNFQTTPVDVGRVGETFFLNVVAGGMLTDVPFKVAPEAKTVLGQMAYILSGAIDLPSQIFRSIPVTLRTRDRLIEDDILLFIVANTTSVAGFRCMTPLASVSDGLLDVLVIHKQGFFDVLPLIAQIMSGDHLNNSRVSYFQTDWLEIECRDSCSVQLDIDGEQGPLLPARIEVLPSAISLLIP